MIDPAEAVRAFDAAFAGAPNGLTARPELSEDAAFLRALFLAGYPLRDVLPGPLLAQQADLQAAALRGNYQDAMRRIATNGGTPIGRIIVDWSGETSHCADVAVLPAYGGRGVGTALLRAWIDAAAQQGLACTLTVAPENPARALYARLGFREAPAEFAFPGVAMRLPAPT
jgi:ribosomal protein S18 acetylase RimI-like enzyme